MTTEGYNSGELCIPIINKKKLGHRQLQNTAHECVLALKNSNEGYRRWIYNIVDRLNNDLYEPIAPGINVVRGDNLATVYG